jgi:integrase
MADKASTLTMDKRRIETHIQPLLGDRRVSSLKLGDIEAMQADIAAGKTAKGDRAHGAARRSVVRGVAARTVSSLHSIFEHAVRWRKIESNPARGVRKRASTPRERRLSTAEIARLGTAMRTLGAEGEHPTGLGAIRLLLLTGFRRMECLALQRA